MIRSARSFRASARALVGLIASLGCSESPPERSNARAVVAGELAPADTAVVRIELEEGSTSVRCSGVLVAPDVVLTAAHCLTGQSLDVDCDTTRLEDAFEAASFRVSPEADLTTTPDPSWIFWEVAEVRVFSPRGALLCGHDLGALRLVEPVAPEVAEPLDVTLEPRPEGASYRVVGYGSSHPSGTGEGVRRTRDGFSIVCVGAACDGRLVEGVAGASSELAPAVAPTEFLGSPGVCPGDSGGPALAPTDDGEVVIGIASRGTSDCRRPVHVRPNEELAAFVRAAALDAGYAVPRWARSASSGQGGATSQPPPAGNAGSPGEPDDSADPPVERTGCSHSPFPPVSPLLPLGLLLLLFRRGVAARAR